MAELNDKNLRSVSGGWLGAGKQVQVKVTILGQYDKDIEIKVYVDGSLDHSKCKTVAASVSSVTYYFSGRGTRSIRIKINNEEIKDCSINFDTDTYIEL